MEADGRLSRALADQDSVALADLLEPLSLSDVLRELTNLSPGDRNLALSLLPSARAAEIVGEAPNELAVNLVEGLETATAAGIIEELGSNIKADVIGELEDAEAEAILARMKPGDAAEIRRLSEYDGYVAGGLMAAEAFTFQETDTVGNVLRRFVLDDEDFERYRGQHPYVVNASGSPVGVVSLRRLLTTRRGASLTAIMVPPVTVPAGMPLEELQDIFNEHPFLGLPVVDADGVLAGVVSRSAVDDALLTRAETENLRRQGVFGDELRSMPLKLRARRRLQWLSANIVLNVIAASVIAAYEETLAAVIAIAVFLPMVSDMSGCSGNQAVAVSMRELSLGLARPADVFRVWKKEAGIGLSNGFVLGVLIGLVAWIWKGNAFLGLVIGGALGLNTFVAVSIGGIVPLVLKRAGQDPATASGPLLTTITDMAGFFLVLSLATAMMPFLV
ncbi:magnesium transporter [Leisingera sp.]|uniref:magnesium transporter n=1 Tax=Leisingera sp. TaxID=1879318 RepID=UPI002B26514E|nr:magnesium transporter [Leisingera sp.]